METGKLIIISAPSGTGKSTIIGQVMQDANLRLSFSISATTRQPREGEQDGVHYYFMSVEQFQKEIADDAFAEYEQVYEGRYYGTLKREIERINAQGDNVILDVDVKGGINVKKLYGNRAMSIFIAPPNIETLRERLIGRGTDSMEEINKRISKAEYELSFAPSFDYYIVNDDLTVAVNSVHQLIADFVGVNEI
ncbi:MAG: guanylate kinase [Muribaculaceae bacterium]|nr:guanylate kinase [Muribaculaceae bacterium]